MEEKKTKIMELIKLIEDFEKRYNINLKTISVDNEGSIVGREYSG